MTQSQIQYFLVVAQTMSISKAAELLFVSQPAVSKQLSLLEEDLEVPLFQRKSQGLEITDAGRAFERLFSDFQLRFKETLSAVRSSRGELHGSFHLGCMEGWDLATFYPGLHAVLEHKYPDIELHLSGYNHDQMLYALRRGEVDAVITMESLFKGYPEIGIWHLTQLGGVLLFSSGSPLAKKPDLCLSDFRDSPFYVTAPQGMKSASADVLAVCKASGFTPRLEYVPTLSAAFMKIQSGTGALLANDWMMAKNNPIFSYLPLDFRRDICIASMAGHSTPLAELVMREIFSYFEDREQSGG